jgi:hypothetical protein
MSELDNLRAEISELECEIEELEKGNYSDNEKEILISDFGTNEIDQLLYDILNEPPYGEIINGTRILRTQELEILHDEHIEKIQLENVLRLNSITVFPISNDEKNEFLGIRFDVFNTFTKKFNISHYIILKQMEYEQISMKELDTVNDQRWRWEIYQFTVPKFIPIREFANKYLSGDYDHHEVNDKNIPGFEQIHKFAESVFEELTQLESIRALILEIKDHFKNDPRVEINSSDIALSTLSFQINKNNVKTHITLKRSGFDNKTINVNINTNNSTNENRLKAQQQLLSHQCGAAALLGNFQKTLVAVQHAINLFLQQ